MERDMALILEYTRLNKLVLSSSKTKLVRFRPTSNQAVSEFSISINGVVVNEVKEVKYLGILLQHNLSWDSHISCLRNKVAPALGILFKMRYLLDSKTKMMLYQSLVQSHLGYLAVIFGWKNTSALRSLQRIQNKALKAVFNLPMRFSTIPLYAEISKNILPVHGLYRYQLLLYIYKTEKNIGYSTLKFSRNQSAFNTRNRTSLRVVRCRLEITKQRIEFIGTSLFNALPHDVKHASNISLFKTKLKKYLLENVEILLA
ncbi:uncharacterized protein LOC142232827 [Haematobia irritans]|uniref:uncharacterized protein LOC142232827 n=1 Tax=Haematobia irritans TaxID=7368 RepID=UPI003F502B57